MTREEALKELRGFIGQLTEGCQEAIKVLIPELAESEDERIRRKMIEHFKNKTKETWCNMPVKDIIAYLEKQKDSKWSPSEGEMGVLYKLCYISNQVTDEDDTELTRLYQDLKREYFNGHSFENMFPKAEKEQKPAECNECAMFLSGECTHPNGKCKNVKPKQEWSDDIIRKAVKEVGLTQHQINWFKTNVFPPRQEWSKEDEETLACAISVFEDFAECKNVSVPPAESKRYLKRLKSLRPSWKPSEEQMTTLLRAEGIVRVHDTKELAADIAQLYEQLKKLM